MVGYVLHMFATDLGAHRHLHMRTNTSAVHDEARLYSDLPFDRCIRAPPSVTTCVPYQAPAPDQDDSITFRVSADNSAVAVCFGPDINFLIFLQ